MSGFCLHHPHLVQRSLNGEQRSGCDRDTDGRARKAGVGEGRRHRRRGLHHRHRVAAPRGCPARAVCAGRERRRRRGVRFRSACGSRARFAAARERRHEDASRARRERRARGFRHSSAGNREPAAEHRGPEGHRDVVQDRGRREEEGRRLRLGPGGRPDRHPAREEDRDVLRGRGSDRQALDHGQRGLHVRALLVRREQDVHGPEPRRDHVVPEDRVPQHGHHRDAARARTLHGRLHRRPHRADRRRR